MGKSFFAKTTNYLLNNPVIQISTLGYLHILIHEMGHALAAKMYGDPNPSINIYTTSCRGATCYSVRGGDFFVTLAGPVLGSIWEVSKLVASISIATIFPSRVGVSLGIFLGVGSGFWIFGEMAYACYGKGDWDFSRLRRHKLKRAFNFSRFQKV